MLRYLGKQAATLVVLLLVASLLIFGLVYLAPGDPLSTLLGNRTPDPQRVSLLRSQYHLNEPFLERYWLWLGSAVQGDFGTSISSQTSVSGLLRSAAPVTLWLIVYSQLLVIVIGTTAAAVAARFKGVPDAIVALGTTMGATIPTFVTAVLLSTVFTVQFRIFPATGAGTGFTDRLWHLTLPAITLAIVSSAMLARIGRAAMREETESPHTLTETARGVPSGRVFRRHVLRNAAPPMLAVVGLQIPAMIAGSVIVERAFGLSGLGSLLLNGATAHDYPVVQTVALLIVLVTVITAVVVDILQGMLDPRVKIGARS